MSIPGSLTPLFNSGSSAAAGYQVSRSLRFNSADSAYLSRTPAVAGNRRTWTWAGWVKVSKQQEYPDQKGLFFAGSSSNNLFRIMFQGSNGQLRIDNDANGSDVTTLLTTQVFRDFSAWMHIVLAVDTTQTTPSNRFKIYVNGTQVTTFSTATYQAQNTDTLVNSTNAHSIGILTNHSPTYPFDGYLADIHFIDGQALTPSSFTEVSATTGQLIPLAYTGSFGTNGFWLKFSDNSAATAATLGNDYSGNNNDWTPNNLSTTTGGPTSVAAASGALPVYNTTDTYGTVKGTGTRTDTNSASIILAIPMDGTNNGTTFTDESATIKGSGSAKSITRNGAVTSTTQSKFYGSSGFFDGTDDYLTTPDDNDFTLGSGDFTIEFFINPSATASKGLFGIIGSGGGTASAAFYAYLTSTNTLFFSAGDGSGETNFTSTAVFTAGTWNHGAIVRNGNTVNFYFSGGLDKSISFTRVVANQSTPFTLGRLGDYVGAGYYNGYIQDFRIYKGVAKYTGNFNPPSSTANATIAAGNDSLVDTPTSYGTDTSVGGEVRGNYATWNPLSKQNGAALANGNLDATYGTSSYPHLGTDATIVLPSSGKWYWEVTVTAFGEFWTGVRNLVTEAQSTYYRDGSSSFNNIRIERTTGSGGTANGASYTNNDVIGVAVNCDALTISWYKNGTIVNSAYSLTTVQNLVPYAGHASVGGSSAATVNFGQRAFAYTAPSGFKALCDTNLPAPLVAKPNTVFDVVKYDGTGAAQSITGLAFNPDFLWIKNRNFSGYNHHLTDAVRGVTKRLKSNTTGSELTSTDQVTAYNSNGFSLGADSAGPGDLEVNQNTGTYVAWAWDAGTSTDPSNGSGSITSQVRANVSAGFSVVTYTGTGANATVGHGLGVAPGFIIIKNRSSATNWRVYHSAIGNTKAIFLSTTGGTDTSSVYWNNTSPTSTVFSVGSDDGANGNTNLMVAYCFTPVVGYSSFGSYVAGSGEPFVYLGFKPALVIIKAAVGRDTAYTSWYIADNKRPAYNPENLPLWANQSAQEGLRGNGSGVYSSDLNIDLLSNGFKIRDNNGAPDETNFTGATYIYCAWAENPFQYARAR